MPNRRKAKRTTGFFKSESIIQRQLLSTTFPSYRHHPVEQRTSVKLRAGGGRGNDDGTCSEQERFDIMANTHGPTRFNGEADNFFDPNFTLDINQRMRVPKSIRVSGDFTDDEVHGINGSAWNIMSEKLEMHVPDRILVVGQEQHIGTKAPPREIAIENAVLPAEPPVVRCITPPRILTLDTHYFPSADEDLRQNTTVDLEDTPVKPRDYFPPETQTVARHAREQTPAFGALDASLPPGEEVQHLRRQVGKLNRRVMAIESEIQQQQQRMKFIYVVTAMYICLKTIFWFGKN